MTQMLKLALFILPLLLLNIDPAWAQSLTIDLGGQGATAAGIDIDSGGDNETVTARVVQIVALMTVLTLAPSILIMMTSFIRIVIVLSFLRTALGVQQTPPNTVMVSLAMFMTFFIMTPTLQASYDMGIKPLINQEVEEMQAIEAASEPFKAFMLKHTRQDDLNLFFEVSANEPVAEPMDTPMQIVVPAFMISELRRAFEIGFMIFLPFLIIDLVTASILMSMGMMMLPPVMISLPFKLIFFVLVDGWYLVVGTLIKSFDSGPPI